MTIIKRGNRFAVTHYDQVSECPRDTTFGTLGQALAWCGQLASNYDPVTSPDITVSVSCIHDLLTLGERILASGIYEEVEG